MKLPSATRVTIEMPVEGGEHHPRVIIPQGTARGGATFEAEIRWALDALRRGDAELAENRLRRILET